MRINDKRNMAIDMMNHFGAEKLVTRKEILEFWNANQKEKSYPYYSCITLNDVFTVSRGQKQIDMTRINVAFPEMKKAPETKSKVKYDTVEKLAKALNMSKTPKKSPAKPQKSKQSKPVYDEDDSVASVYHDDPSDLIDTVRSGRYL